MKNLTIILITVISIGGSCPQVSAGETNPDKNLDIHDTVQLQDELLTKINRALNKGFISPEQASDYQHQLNIIGGLESQYKSLSMPVPKNILQQDQDKLKDLSANVEKQLPHEAIPPDIAFDTMHTDTGRLISQALASSKITTAQAAQYYSRLAQIENDLESLRNEFPIPDDESQSLTKDLESLHADLQKKLK